MALVVVMTMGSLGLVAGGVAVPREGAHLGTTVAPNPAARGTASPTAGSSTPVVTNLPTNPAGAMAEHALAATRAAGLRSNVVFIPRPSASPEQVAAAREAGVVSPVTTGTPAPMGLAYYGLSEGPGGSVLGRVLNTTSIVGTVNLSSPGVQAADLFQSSPDAFGIQLNAVVTNVTLFGTAGYSFWTQNVVEFYPATGLLVLVTNVWNWSSPTATLTPNVFAAHSVWGTPFYSQLGYYYAEYLVPAAVSYPFDLTLFLNSTVVHGNDSVEFNVVFQSAGGSFATQAFSCPGAPSLTCPFDYVVFNSTAPGGTPVTVPSNYTADGLSYNSVGITNDFELIFGGPGGGSQATLLQANATLGLGYWDGTSYVAVPSAYDYGGETGETVTGANVAWSNSVGGRPYPGLATYGTMTTGPSILTGLWNASAPEGSTLVVLGDAPTSNAFNVFAPAGGWSSNFTISELSVTFPSTRVVYLIPGNYTVVTELSDYAPVVTPLQVTGVPTCVCVHLAPSSAMGIYTPLWAFGNSQIPDLSVSGSGVPTDPYVLENNQYGLIGSEFGLYNDWGFPVYPAVFFYGTSASTEFYHPPSFATATNTFQFPGPFLPATNDLQYWFWNVTNVSVIGATNISGWFGSATYYPTVFDTFNMIFFASSHNLVARNTFSTEGQALLVASGGTIFGPLNVGGGNNTVWGNRFLQIAAPPPATYLPCASCLPMAAGLGLGMEIAESYDTIYNNYVDTPTTAWVLPINLYSAFADSFRDAFNITSQPATNVHYATGFPYLPLTGSILGTNYQGGNYWWDYGVAFNPYNGASNPYGVLPYDENAQTPIVYIVPGVYNATYIYPGGDYVPLIPFVLHAVTVQESGLYGSPLPAWGVRVVGTVVLDNFYTTQSHYEIWLPAGTYLYSANTSPGWWGPSAVPFLVVGPTTVTVPFQPTYTVTVHEKGLALGLTWGASVYLNGVLMGGFQTGNASYGLDLPNGTYRAMAVAPLGWTAPSGVVKVAGRSAAMTFSFRVARGYVALAFTERGLARNTAWTVEVNGSSPTTYAFNATETTTGASLVFAVATGNYTYAIPPIGGYNITTYWSHALIVPASLTVHLVFQVAVYQVTFQTMASGALGGKLWTVTIDGKRKSAVLPRVPTVRGSVITFDLPNGTYAFAVAAPFGWVPSPSSGVVSILGGVVSPQIVEVSFSHR